MTPVLIIAAALATALLLFAMGLVRRRTTNPRLLTVAALQARLAEEDEKLVRGEVAAGHVDMDAGAKQPQS